MRRFAARALVLLPAVLASEAVDARTTIDPYIEVQQVFSADLSGHSQDAVTYTGVAAGVDISLDGPKVQGQLDYRYDHYFSWSHRYRDTDTHNGLASFSYQPTPDLSLQAAGIATRARGSLSTGTPGLLFGDIGNTQQVYAIQAGPSYSRHAGDFDIDANYRFGWTHTGNGFGSVDLGPGQPVLQNSFTTITNTVDASIGMRPGVSGLPFGWKVSGGYEHDDVHFLDARYNDVFGRVDVTYPVTDSIALEGGIGYERGRASQSAILVDAAGDAVLDSHSHLQADTSKARLLSYDQEGLIWDVGVLWRPSTRTSLEVRGGQRYGQTVVTGNFSHKLTPTATFEVVAYDDIESFGRQLTSGIGSLPTSFANSSLPVPTPLATCVFGANGGQGGCLPALSSVNSNFYRSRGVYAVLSATHGLWSYGFGLGYDNRRYLAPDFGPNIFSFAGVKEQSVTADAIVQRQLSRLSTVSLSALASWYDNNAFGDSYTAYGGVASYTRLISRRLVGSVSISVSSGSGGTNNNDVIGTALIALRYQL